MRAEEIREILLGSNAEAIGSTIRYRDEHYNTVLHLLLCDGCFCSECVQEGVFCLEKILSTGVVDPNAVNRFSETPLHFVVQNMVPLPMVQVLAKYGASLSGRDGIVYDELAKQMVSKYPEVLALLFDYGISLGSGSHGHEIVLDLTKLVYSKSLIDSRVEGKIKKWAWQETGLLYDVASPRNKKASNLLLNHPLTMVYELHKYPLFFLRYQFSFTFFYTLFFLIFYSFVWVLFFNECQWENENLGPANSTDPEMLRSCASNSIHKRACYLSKTGFNTLTALASLTLFSLVMTILPELRKLYYFGIIEYLKLWQTYITVGQFVSVAVTISPMLTFQTCVNLDWEYSWGAVTILLSSVIVLTQLSPIETVAVYTEMLFKVFFAIVKASLCLIPLAIGFYFSFRMLGLEDINPFKLLTMIFNDEDYEAFIDKERGTAYTIVCYIVFVTFILLMVLVVINFLIGVAVSDVQALKAGAKLGALCNRISNCYLMDCIYGGSGKHTLTAKEDDGDTVDGPEGSRIDRFQIRINPLRPEVKIESNRGIQVPLDLQRSLLDIARRTCYKSGRRIIINRTAWGRYN